MRATLLVFLVASSAFAQPKLTSISSQWIQRGTSIDLTLAGERLSSITGFVFSGESGLSATLIPPPPAPKANVGIESESGAFTVTPPAKLENSKSMVVRLSASTNATLGGRELRVVSPSGISEPRTINIGALAEIKETEPNNTSADANPIELPATINGVISGATEIDSFKFKVNKGDVVAFDVDASQRGSPLDSSLAILDTNGKELARSEDVNGFDSLLHFTAPDAGEFIAQIRDFQYRGGSDYSYRLHAGALPYVETIFPLGGQRGKPVELTLAGRNISSAEKMTLNADVNAPLGRQEIRLKLPQGFSNPIPFDVQDLPEIIEVETKATNVVTVPGIINGRIEAAKDVDYFSFKSEVDQKLVLEVNARRFGSPLDALLLVYANGTLLTQNDDTAGSGADARVEIDAKKGTEYLVAIRDLTERGGNEFTYRVSLRPPQPSFTARFFPDAIRIHRGGLTKIRCEVQRTGFDGAVEFQTENFPDGIIAEP
ncbi:MAG TPA: PPC domain-containing protein, partial [Candidatus Acidoferrum sp.]|nr:PPC domain-containing protein [Candidatus Acidoferrum sp.]